MRGYDAAVLYRRRHDAGDARGALEYVPAMHGVAIVLHDDANLPHMDEGWRAYTLRSLADEGRRRARATERVCHVAAMAFEEGFRAGALALMPAAIDYFDAQRTVDRVRASYTQLRGFLVGELDAHDVIACRVAMERTARHARLYDRIGDTFTPSPAERGWL